MSRPLALAAFTLALAVGGTAFADAGAPYKLDAAGKCHDSKGAFAKAAMCTKAAAPAAGGKCRDAKGHFAKCGTPGAKPAK